MEMIVSPRFCVPRSVDLAITKKIWQIIGNCEFVINDAHGNVMFKVEKPFFSLDCTRLIRDAANIPVLTLRKKIISAYNKWEVFRGTSTEEKNLIFSARRSSMIQMKTNLHVFLANNKSENVCDYSVKGSWFQRSCKVYVGDSSTIVAQMKKNYSIGSQLSGKDRFMVTVCPNIDYAFIAALIIILDEINSHKSRRSNNSNK